MKIKKINFPYLALALGMFLLLVITMGSKTDAEGITALPLLTLLIFTEGAFLLTAVGGYLGLKHMHVSRLKFSANPFYFMTTVICILLAILFAIHGIRLWPL